MAGIDWKTKRENMEKIETVCVECVFSVKRSDSFGPVYFCKKEDVCKRDPVYGLMKLTSSMKCENKNRGHCPDFEKRPSKTSFWAFLREMWSACLIL